MVLRAFLPIVTCVVALAGCATDELPLPNDPRARNTGTFPTFAAVPAAAAPQLPQAQVNSTVMRLEDAEAAALGRPVLTADAVDDLDATGAFVAAEPRPMMVEERIARLDEAGRRARQGVATSADERARLARLGRTHGEETLRRIEASGDGEGAGEGEPRCVDGTLPDGSPCPE